MEDLRRDETWSTGLADKRGWVDFLAETKVDQFDGQAVPGIEHDILKFKVTVNE
jgi:hypothetical protein